MRSAAVLFLFLLSTLFAGCDEGKVTDPPPAAKGAVKGQVWHRLHPEQVLEGVTVSWGEAEDVTDAEGRYDLSDLDAGADSLRLRREGFHGEAEWLEIEGDSLSRGYTLLPVDLVPPLAPSSFTASTEDGSYILLRWEAPEDETRTGFALWKTPGDPHFQILPAEQDSLLDIQVAPLRDYEYTLQCRDAYGNLSESLQLTVEVDTYPAHSEIEVLADADFSHVPLSWTENLDPDFLHYRLYRTEDGNADSLDVLVYQGTDNSYSDEDVEPNEVFSYRVYTFDETGNASTHTRSEIDAAAQIYLPDYEETSALYTLPDGNSCWVVGRNSGTIRRVNGEGELLDEISPSTGSAFWTFNDAGDEAVGMGSSPTHFSHLAMDPLNEISEAERNWPSVADLAWVDGQTVLLSWLSEGPPVFVDLASFEITDTLRVVDDTDLRAMLTVDGPAGILYIADVPDQGRLRAVDLSGNRSILQEVVLPGSPVEMKLSGDGEIVITYLGPSRVDRRLLADLEQIMFSLDIEGSPDRMFLTPDVNQLWYSDFETRTVRGIDLNTSETIREMETIGLTLDIQLIGDGTRLFAGQTSDLVNILSLDRSND